MLAKHHHNDYVQTYFALRLSMGLLALFFPLLLYFGAQALQGIGLQPSLSAYYHTDVGDIFVGVLFSIGFCLIAYKGFGRPEDWALNIGGVLACLVALSPMLPEHALECFIPHCEPDSACVATSALYDRTSDFAIRAGIHYKAAVGFFAMLAYVMVFCSHRTLYLVPKIPRRFYLATYVILGITFFLSMIVTAYFLTYITPADVPCHNYVISGIEICGVLSFAAYWLVKTHECYTYETDRLIPNRRASPPIAPSLRAGLSVPTPTPAKHPLFDVKGYLALWRA